jgi:hypothetical protein
MNASGKAAVEKVALESRGEVEYWPQLPQPLLNRTSVNLRGYSSIGMVRARSLKEDLLDANKTGESHSIKRCDEEDSWPSRRQTLPILETRIKSK